VRTPFVDPFDSLRRLFQHGFTVEDLAEPLVSYDFDQPAAAVRRLMAFRDFDVAGIRAGGVVGAWVRGAELVDGTCADHMHAIQVEDVVPARMPLAELLPHLETREFALVSAFGAVAGIVTRADLQKPAVRMWVFGLLTLLEQATMAGIRRRFPRDSWRGLLSASRVARAEALQAERLRRYEALELVDCLSFGDKAWVLFKDPDMLERMGFASRSAARERMKEFEALRNRLAHAHQLRADDLTVMARLARQLDRMAEVLSSLA